jgi:hypothetical protein
MALPLFLLLTPIRGASEPDSLEWEAPHEQAASACNRCYRIAEGHVILTEWQRILHCVIYQTPLTNGVAIESRNLELFEHYGEGFTWKEILDNGFGKTYRREDMHRFALWSYAMDYNTFGSMEFHQVMWG